MSSRKGTVYPEGVSTDTQLPVDLKMAHTYIPGILCIAKATVLVVTVSNSGAIRHLPTLLLFAFPLYLDRVTRSETIFDSNSLLCALFSSFLMDSARAEHTGDLALHQIIPAVWGYGMSCALVLLSAGITAEIQPLVHADAGIIGRSWVLVLQSMLLVGTMQANPTEDRSDQRQLCLRSSVFVVLCLIWTYSVGIRAMVDLLNSTTRLPIVSIISSKSVNKRGTQSVVVQAFTPCIMRFGAVLFLDGWAQLACIVLSVVTLIYQIIHTGGFHTDKSMYGESVDYQVSPVKTDPPETMRCHPEYKNSSSSYPFSTQWSTAPLFLQQDTDCMGTGKAAIRRAPIGVPVVDEENIIGMANTVGVLQVTPQSTCMHQQQPLSVSGGGREGHAGGRRPGGDPHKNHTTARESETADADGGDVEAYMMLKRAKENMNRSN